MPLGMLRGGSRTSAGVHAPRPRWRMGLSGAMSVAILLGVLPFTLGPTPAGATSGADHLVFSKQPGDGTPGGALATQPEVTIEDSSNATVSSIATITLALKGSSGGTLTRFATLTCDQTSGGVTSMAAVAGVAAFTGCTVSGGGIYSLTATDSADSLTKVSSDFFVSGPAQLAFTSDLSGGGTAAQVWTTQPQVTVEDAHGTTVSASTANIGLAIKSGTGTSGATLSCTHLQVAASLGVASFGGCAIDKVGTGYELVATDSTDTLISPVSASFDIQAGSPSALVFSKQPSGGNGGAAFGTQPEVTVKDAGGNTVAANTDSISLSIDSGTGTLGAHLTCTSTSVAAVAGVATFGACAIDDTGTGYKLTASDSTHSLTVNSAAFDVTAGSAAHITFHAEPGGGAGGAAWGTQPEVTLTDAGGNPVAGAVMLAIKGSTGAAGAALTCASNPLTASGGVASFSGCGIDLAGTGYKLTATSGSLSVDSGAFDITTGSAAHAVFTHSPGDGTGGSALSSQPVVVSLTDSGGNTAAGSVLLSITSGTGAPGAALSCDLNPVAAVGGVASFTGCAVDKVGTGYTLTATSGSATAQSQAFAVTLGGIAKLAFTAPPGGGTGGVRWANQPIVAVEDAGGNHITGSSASIVLSITAGTGAGTLTCTANPLPAVRGSALFDGCRIDTAASAYTLTARDIADGLSVVSAPFAVTAGAAAKLVFTTQPSGAAAGVVFPTQPVVAVADAGGNTVASSTASIALSITPGTGTSGAALTCTANPLAAAAGQAAFDSCSIDKAGGGYTVTATDAADSLSAESLPFSILAPPPQPLGLAPTGVPLAQTFGGRLYGVNPTAVADHVNSASGELTFAATDLRVAGIGVPLSLQRVYNSADTTGGAFGPGWSSLLDLSVKVVKNTTATVRGEDGQQLVWTYNPATASWVPPPGAQASLSCGSKQCTLTRNDGYRWDVNLTSSGTRELMDFLAPDGQGLRFAWGSNSVTITIDSTNTTPYNVLATLNSAGEVTGLSTPTPAHRTVSYTYDSGHRLTSVTDTRGQTWSYVYSSGRLVTETDPLGHLRLTATYDGSGRVTAVSSKGSQQHTDDIFSWNPATQTSTRQALANAGGTLIRESYVDQYLNNVLVAQTVPAGGVTRFSWDAQLNLLETQDPMGWVSQMTYDTANNMTSQSTPISPTSSATIHMTYDPSHRLTSQTNADGNTTVYVYNGPYLGFIRPPGPTTPGDTFTYNKIGELIQVVNPIGQQLYTYDAFGNQTSLVLETLGGAHLNGNGTRTTYDEAGDVLTSTDPRGTTPSPSSGFTTTRTYDSAGNLLSTTTPGPQTTSTAYNAAGDIASIVDAAGHTTSYSWNEGTLTRTTTTPSGSITQTFDPSGNLLLETNSAQRTTTHVFDSAGREVKTTDPANVTVQYAYDIENNVIVLNDSNGDVITQEFDSLNRMIRQVNNGAVTLTGYDPASNIVSTTDAFGTVTTTAYNPRGKVASVTNAAGTTSYGYDAADDVVSRTDPNGHVTAYTYDGAARQTSMATNGSTWTYAYDVAGNVFKITDPDSRTTTYTLDALNRPATTVYAQALHPSITVTQQWDGLGRRTGMTDPTGTHSYAYDAAGNMVSATTGSDTFTYDYSAPGKITETYPDGTSMAYAVDDAMNLMSVQVGTQGSSGYVDASYVRNTLRQTTSIAFSNGVLESRTVDQAGHVLDQALQNSGGKLADDAFTYDIAGNRLSQVDNVGGTAISNQYGYDAVGRLNAFSTSSGASPLVASSSGAQTLTPTTTTNRSLASAPLGGGSSNGAARPVTARPFTASSATRTTASTRTARTLSPVTPTYTYDGTGNQLSSGSGAGTTSSTYNAGDEIASQSGPGGTTAYQYDKNGDLTRITGPSTTQTFTYDAAARLVGVTTTPGTTATYTYDGDGNRVSKTVGGNVTNYLWDPAGAFPQLAIERTGAGSPIRRYIYGDGPVAVQTPTATYFYHLDPQGTVSEMTDASGAIVAEYHYDGFGNLLSSAGSAAAGNPLRFQGQYLDADTGLYNLRARNYDTATGRFTQRDPVAVPVGAPTVSPYVFVGDHPTTLADPTGRDVTPNSVFWGKSSLASNVTTDINYAVTVIKFGIKAPKAYTTIKDFFASKTSTVVDELAQDTGGVAEATGEVAAEAGSAEGALGSIGEEAGSSGEALAGAGDLARFAGPALAVVGIGLATFITVEDCMHGTVAQCVGDVVGTTIAIAFTIGCSVITAGAGAILCGIAGAILSTGLQFVIANYGPQIAAGIVSLYDDAAAGISKAIPVVAAALTSAGDAIVSAYNTAAGAIATGINEATTAISSGFQTALTTLVNAGYTAAQIAGVLASTFNEGINDAVGALVSLGYSINQVAQALITDFATTAEQAAQLFKDGFNYTVDQVAGALKDIYGLGAQAAAQILKDVNYAVDEVASALNTVYTELAADVAPILQAIGYGVQQIGAALQQVFAETDQAVAAALHTLGYLANEVSTALVNLFADVDTAVASALNFATYTANQIAGALLQVFSDPAQTAANILKGLAFAADVVAGALDTVFSLADQAAAQIMENIGFAINAVATALMDVYLDIDTAVAGVLRNIGNTVTEIGTALHVAFSEADQAVATALKAVGYLATEVATALHNVFSEADAAVAAVLKDVAFTAHEIAAALQAVFADAAQAVAQILKDISFALNDITAALQTVFNEAAQACASILMAIGYTADQIATALEDIYNQAAAAVASILKAIGETASAIAGALADVFNQAASDIANLLSDIGFDSSTIDAIGGAFASFGQSVADCFSSFFSDC